MTDVNKWPEVMRIVDAAASMGLTDGEIADVLRAGIRRAVDAAGRGPIAKPLRDRVARLMARVTAIVKEKPGIHAPDVVAAAGKRKGDTYEALRRLVAAGDVKPSGPKHRRRYRLAGEAAPEVH